MNEFIQETNFRQADPCPEKNFLFSRSFWRAELFSLLKPW